MTVDAAMIVDRVLAIRHETEVRPDEFKNARAIHESCLRSWGLLSLARDLLVREWPHEAILVTLQLADTLANARAAAMKEIADET